jgi:hypothetical protein
MPTISVVHLAKDNIKMHQDRAGRYGQNIMSHLFLFFSIGRGLTVFIKNKVLHLL